MSMLVRLDVHNKPLDCADEYPDGFQFVYDDDAAAKLKELLQAYKAAKAITPDISSMARTWNQNEGVWYDVIDDKWVPSDGDEGESGFCPEELELLAYGPDDYISLLFTSPKPDDCQFVETASFSFEAIDKAYRSGTPVWTLDKTGEVISDEC